MRVTLLAAAVTAPGLAFAQTAPAPEIDGDRFQIERDGDSIIRLDKKTGTISVCTPDGASLDCRMSADERAALQAEIDRLATELEQARAGSTEDGKRAGISKDGTELTLKLPSEEDIKDVVSFFEEMLNRFVAAVREFAGGNA